MNRFNSAFTTTTATVGLLIAALVLQGCGQSSAQTVATAAVPLQVSVASARAAGEQMELRLPARALAGELARLYPRATGFVRERQVDLGEQVEAGQVLARIDAPEIDQAVNEAQASLGQAIADQALAQQNFDRAAQLVKTGAVSGAIFDERQAALNVSKAARVAAQARLDSARERQSFQVVRAPFAGVVAARNIERGDRVVGDAAAAAPMFEIAVLDPLRVVVDVPQSAVLQVQPGLLASVHFQELAGEPLPATVRRSAMRISDDAGGMRVELELANPQGRIPAGMVGEVRLQLPRQAAVVLVPIAAVQQGAGGARVARLEGDSVRFQAVTLGRNLGNEVEVLSGLEAGASVVLAPNALLAEGSTVQVRAQAAP